MIRLRDLLLFVLSQVSFFFLGLLPSPLLRVLGRWFGTLRQTMRPRERENASSSIERTFGRGRSLAQQAQILDRSYGIWGRLLIARHLPDIHQGNFVKKVSLGSLRELYQARDRQSGMIVVCGPQGQWELTCRVMAYLNLKPTVVMSAGSNFWQERKLRKWFLKQGVKAVRRPDEEEAILGDLRDRGLVCFNSFIGEGDKATKNPFFETDIWVDTRPARLALESGAAILLANTLILDGGYYLLKLGAAVLPREEVAIAEEHERITMALIAEVQRQVSFQPEYWPWMRTKEWLVTSDQID